MNTRGFTLVEISISCAMLVSMLVVITVIHQMGSSAWSKVRVQTEMLQGMQVTSRQLTLELENSCPQSVTVTPEAVFFLSARDNDGATVMGADGRLSWQRYVGYYFDPVAGEVRRVEVPLGATAAVSSQPVPIQDHLPSTPLASHQTGGKVLARNVTACEFQQIGENVRMTALCESNRYGRQGKESLSFAWEGRPQNPL